MHRRGTGDTSLSATIGNHDVPAEEAGLRTSFGRDKKCRLYVRSYDSGVFGVFGGDGAVLDSSGLVSGRVTATSS